MHVRGGHPCFPLRKYAAAQPKFWKNLKLESTNVDAQYIYISVKAFNYFMPRETLSLKGPGNGEVEEQRQDNYEDPGWLRDKILIP